MHLRHLEERQATGCLEPCGTVPREVSCVSDHVRVLESMLVFTSASMMTTLSLSQTYEQKASSVPKCGRTSNVVQRICVSRRGRASIDGKLTVTTPMPIKVNGQFSFLRIDWAIDINSDLPSFLPRRDRSTCNRDFGGKRQVSLTKLTEGSDQDEDRYEELEAQVFERPASWGGGSFGGEEELGHGGE